MIGIFLHHIQQEIVRPDEERRVELIPNPADVGDWVEDSRRTFSEQFKYGLNRTRVQMIRLSDHDAHRFLSVEAINIDTDDWVFGCNALESDGRQRYWYDQISFEFSSNFV